MNVRRTAVSSEVGFKPGRVYLGIDRDAVSPIMIVVTAEPAFELTCFVRALVRRNHRWELDSWRAHVDNWIEVVR